MEITWIGQEDKSKLQGVIPDQLLQNDTFCICALEENNLRGCLIARPFADTVIDLPYLFVVDQYRRQKIASDMLLLLTTTMKTIGVGAVVMGTAVSAKDEDDHILDFALASGFSVEDESSILSAPLPDVIRRIDGLHKMKPYHGDIVSLSDLTARKWSLFVEEIAKHKAAEEAEEERSSDRQVFMIPEERGAYDGDLSHIALGEGSVPVAALLIHKDEDTISVDYLCNFNQGAPQVLVHMMKSACDEAVKLYPKDADLTVSFHAYNPAAEKMGRTLLGKHLTTLGRGVYLTKYL